ncbi:hypothetical protein AB0K60_31455 [Thermopolyspora sp. NPDC052614]|uniref:hypothetical protein n=1 Tax=Thermopolyspora sp. NPDC052614 TaxID=3155682 RepID=UPI0034313F8A
MSASRRRRTNPPAPAPETPVAQGDAPSWFQPAQHPPSAPSPPPTPPPTASPPATPPVATPPVATPSAYGPAATPPVPAAPVPEWSSRAAGDPREETTGRETAGGEPVAESRERAPRRRRRRRPMPRSRRVALQLLAGVTLTGALLGLKSYDALDRYEGREPPPAVRTVPVGQTATLENARWRLVAIGPMPNPPENNRPERLWLQMTLEMTPLNKDALQYDARLQYGQSNIDLDDGDGHTWRVEVLKAPEELRQGEPGEFTLVAVVPKALAERVEPVLWPTGKSGTGPGLRFDR